MKINIQDFLPEEISDETAYHLATFFMDIALALDSCYFAQMHRHLKSISGPRSLHNQTGDFDDEFPF